MFFKITVLLITATKTLTSVCNYNNSVELTNRSYNGKYYGDGEYFVDNLTGEERGCVCIKQICARKCCPMFEQVFDVELQECVEQKIEFNPPVWNLSNVRTGLNAVKEFHFFSGLKCSKANNEVKIIVGEAADDYHLTTDGRLYVFMEDAVIQQQFYGPDKYCIDNFWPTKVIDALVCFTDKKESNSYVQNASCMLVSCFFIILTMAVYAFLPELRTTVHGKIMLAFLLSFFIAFFFMAVMQILLYIENMTPNMCTNMTFVIYISALSAFFWMNVMCYDLWRIFRQLRATTKGRVPQNSRRILWYCVYAYGVPIALTILVAALEFGYIGEYSKLLPNIRRQACFLTGTGKFIYFYSPMLIVCMLNLVLFGLVARNIAQIKKQTEILKKNDKQRFILYIKLFVVTGGNWIMEAISDFFPEVNQIWIFTDAYNVFVGFTIFVIFVCKRKIWRLIQYRYCQLRNQHNKTSTSAKSRI